MIRAQQILDRVFEAKPRKKVVPTPAAPVAAPVPPQPAPAPAAQPAPAAPLMNPSEMDSFVLTTLGYGDFIKLLDYTERYGLSISGRVHRTSSHYVHQRSTSFEFNVEGGYGENEPTPEENAEIETLANSVQETIEEEIVDLGGKIYRALEREYDYMMSDEAVEENIKANEYDFDEEGGRHGDFQYDQLSDDAKESAREWYRNLESRSNDNYWAEHIIEEWNTQLEKMGFEETDISWSGFSSQGDGASFECKYFDFPKYAKFFMSGQDKEESQPYTDEEYRERYEQRRKEADALRAAGNPPVAESDLGIDMNDLARDAVYDSFGSIATPDTDHESFNHPGEKCYATRHSSPDNKSFIRTTIFDRPARDGASWVLMKALINAYENTADGHREAAGMAEREVKFFVPEGRKSRLVSAVLDYLTQANKALDHRDKAGRLVNPKQKCNSLVRRLSMLAGLWKQENQVAYNEYLRVTAQKIADENPALMARYDANVQAVVSRMKPEPSEEKLKLRAEMKKWKKERDAAAAAVPPAPQQESDDELLTQMGDVALRGAVANLGSIMTEQPMRYMSGAKQYHWHSTTPDWRWKITVDATVYDEQLANQPWDVDIAVRDNKANESYRIDKLVVTPDEKNHFGVSMQKLIPKVIDIAERAFNEVEGLLRELEIAFNGTLGPKQTASPRQKIATFYKY